ncbi:amidohydrolase family protein [Streptomyces sp. NPDC040750]|uniref:amidohydrolase family protein n=1 Tax=Streptomyces sp. NPDC040750 TaxID=3154491 RepID=UPI00340C274E
MTDPTPDRLRDDVLLLVPEVTLTPDGPLERQAVVVRDGVFLDVGPVERIVRAHPSPAPVRLPGHVLMPGFVDTHHHLTQSFGGSLAFGEPSEIFRRVWVPLERALDEESAYVAAKLAALESLRGGFTAVAESGTRAAVDMDVLASATRDAGIRCVLDSSATTPRTGRERTPTRTPCSPPPRGIWHATTATSWCIRRWPCPSRRRPPHGPWPPRHDWPPRREPSYRSM